MSSDIVEYLHWHAQARRPVRDRAMTGADLHGQCLDQLRARSVDLTGANLRQTSLLGSRWTACALDQAHLESARFGQAVLRLCTLDGVHAAHASFAHARLENSHAIGACLDHADFSGAVLTDSDFSRASLRKANLEGISASGVNFRGADLSGAILCHAVLTDADLRGSDFTGADLTGADLAGADLRGAVGIATPEPPDALPGQWQALSDTVAPLVGELLRCGADKGLITPQALDAIAQQVAGLRPPCSPGHAPSPATLQAVARTLDHFGDDLLPKLVQALRQPNDAAPSAEVVAMIRQLSRELALDESASTDEVVDALLDRSQSPT